MLALVVSAHPHLAADRLARFLRGDLSREENRAVVRHLLAGCRLCAAITRARWAEIERLSAPASRRRAVPIIRGRRLPGSRRLARFSSAPKKEEA